MSFLSGCMTRADDIREPRASPSRTCTGRAESEDDELLDIVDNATCAVLLKRVNELMLRSLLSRKLPSTSGNRNSESSVRSRSCETVGNTLSAITTSIRSTTEFTPVPTKDCRIPLEAITEETHSVLTLRVTTYFRYLFGVATRLISVFLDFSHPA